MKYTKEAIKVAYCFAFNSDVRLCEGWRQKSYSGNCCSDVFHLQQSILFTLSPARAHL